MENKILRIGTRDSALAVWQAKEVARQLLLKNIKSTLVFIKSPADIDLKTPLHQFGNTGIFTKVLDDAIVNNEIDIAVHSLKDYPTHIPEELCLSAVLERGFSSDILVYKGEHSFLENHIETTIATGSIRRIAQWKSKYPHHKLVGLRGNVQTRLNKLKNNTWGGAIFAKAGLSRINILPKNHIELDWMIPAPAQGVIGITCHKKNIELVKLLKTINHTKTYIEASVERQFLQTVEGGCSAPVGAFAITTEKNIALKAGVFALDGSHKILFEGCCKTEDSDTFGAEAAKDVLKRGGQIIMQNIQDGQKR